MDDRPASRPSPAWAFSFVLGIVALQLTVGVAAQLANIAVGLVITEALLFAAPALLACRLLGYPPAGLLAAGRPGGAWLALGVALGVANYPIAGALEALVRGLNPEWRDIYDSSLILSGASGPELGLLVVAVGGFAPVCEELAFRGFIQRVLGATWRPAAAILASAMLFSAIHFDPIGFPARVELGLLFGLLAYWSGSLWTGVAAHAANNLFATGLFLAFNGRDTSSESPGTLQLLALLLLGVGVSAPLLALARRLRRPAPPIPERAPYARLRGDVAAWGLAIAVSLGALYTLESRGARLSIIDSRYPTARLRASIHEPSARRRVEAHLRSLRARARRGEISVESYEAQRKSLTELAGKLGPDEVRDLEAAGVPDGG